MKLSTVPTTVTVQTITGIQLDKRELGFLRVMAEFCVANMMEGCDACQDLIKVLDRAQIPQYPGGPTYGLFEEV